MASVIGNFRGGRLVEIANDGGDKRANTYDWTEGPMDETRTLRKRSEAGMNWLHG